MKREKIFLLALTLLAAGCAAKDTSHTVTITYQTMETLPQQRIALSQLVEEFHKTHPGITVKVQTSPSGFQKLQAQVAAGDPPDVFYYISDRLPALVHRKAVLDLQPFLAQDPSVDLLAYFPKAVDSCKIGEGMYCFPFHFSTDVLFYNKNLFDKAALAYPDSHWTWDDFAKAAGLLTKTNQRDTQQYGTLQPRAVLLIKSFGGDCFTDVIARSPTTGGATKQSRVPICVIDSPAASKGLEFLRSLVESGAAPQTAALRDIEIMDGVTLFSTGRVGMLLGRTYMLVEFSKLKDLDWDVALVPKGQRRYSRLAVGGNCISSKTAHPKEAWEFVKFFSGKEGSRILGNFRNCVPALQAAAKSQIFLQSPPSHVNVFLDALETAEIENPGMILWQEYLDKIVQPSVENMLFGKAAVPDVLHQMQSRGEEFLKEEKRLRNWGHTP